MNKYLTSKCANCTRWCNDDYDYGCTSLDPYSCIYIQRTILKNRMEVKTGDGKTVQHSN
jgi:hypothetical protein